MLKRSLAACVLAFAFVAPSQAATTVLPRYLEEIVNTAALAFDGACVGNHTVRDRETNLIVTYTTFAVYDVLKGSVDDATYTIKQIGGTIPGEPGLRIEGVPTFAVGEKYVVFLSEVSSAGFSSPVGLEQGRFIVRGDRASNGRDVQNMMVRVSGRSPGSTQKNAAASTGDFDLESLKQVVRGRAIIGD